MGVVERVLNAGAHAAGSCSALQSATDVLISSRVGRIRDSAGKGANCEEVLWSLVFQARVSELLVLPTPSIAEI